MGFEILNIALSVGAALASVVAMSLTTAARNLVRVVFRNPRKSSVILRVPHSDGDGYLEISGEIDDVTKAASIYTKTGTLPSREDRSVSVRHLSPDQHERDATANNDSTGSKGGK